jgi:neutral ceramidase
MIRATAIGLLGIACGLFSLAVNPVDGAEKQFRVGAWAQDVTPLKFPISTNGGMTDRQSQRAHDPLHARCLVLDDGATKLAIVVVDSCVIPRELMDSAKSQAQQLAGIPANHILISATHTHTAPTVTAVFQSDPDVAYQKYLAAQIAQGIKRASDNLAPARIGWGVGRDETQVFNRRWKLKEGRPGRNPFGLVDRALMNPGYKNPDVIEPLGPVDPEISFVCAETPAGRPLALLANYSLHYVGGTGPDELSADYFAVFAERVGQLLHAGRKPGETLPPFMGAMSNGTSGDVNNINFGGDPPPRSEPYEKMKLVAESVAQATLAAHGKMTHHDWVPLKVAERDIELAVRKPTPEEISRAQEILAAAAGRELKSAPEFYARETLKMAEFPSTVKVKLQAMRIGELGIAAIPCEVFTEIGLEIKKKSPLKPTFTIELANGYNGYLPTPAQHELRGYETWRARSSYLEVEASTKITATVLELLNEVASN